MAIHKVSKVIMFTVLALGAAGVAPAALAAGNPGDSHASAYLGVMVDAVPAATAEALHLKNGGAFIANVDQDGPACHAGLQSGDVVVAYNGKPVTGSEQFAGLIHDSAAGSTVMMTVIRNGQSKDIKVKLGDWRQMAGMPRAPLSPVGTMPFAAPERPPLPPRAYPDIDMMGSTPISARQGIQVEPLSPQLCDFFGVGENKGVLVRTVEKGSPGAAAGLRAGDVVVKVDNETIHDTADWRRALKAHGGKVTMVIVRDKHEQTVQLTMPGNTSEWKGQDWDGFGVDAATLAMLNSNQMKELQQQAESMAKSMAPEIQKQTEEMRKQAEKAAKSMTPEIKKQAEEMSKEIEKIAPQMAKNAREMADSMKPSAEEVSAMAREAAQQWKEMQPQLQKQMDELKKQLEQEQREWQKMFKESNPNQM
ncbi:MAG: PDZ domain-containing protein [Candidatus Korobacteraceae bacterium]